MSDFTTTLDAYCDAVAALDPTAVLAHYAADTRVFDGMGAWEYGDKAAWGPAVHEWLTPLSGEGVCRIDRRRVTELGDLALVDGLTFYGADLDGERAEVTSRFTQVWRRDGGTWHIVHEHTSWPLGDDMKGLPAPD